MPTETDPVIDKWYRRLDDGTEFKVTSLDEDEATFEVQYIDGDVDVMDLDTWYEWDMKPIAAPDGWTGSSDDELEHSDADLDDEEWTESLEDLRSKEIEDDWRDEEEE